MSFDKAEISSEGSNEQIVMKPEYKEYMFEPLFDPETETRISSFWQHVEEKKLIPAKSNINTEIELGAEEQEDGKSVIVKEDKRWRNTLALFRKCGLDKDAGASKPKTCHFCVNDFEPKYADDDYKDFADLSSLKDPPPMPDDYQPNAFSALRPCEKSELY